MTEGDRRKLPRHRTFKGGTISSASVAGITCVVRNLSAAGAMLEVESEAGIPDEFTLVIKPEYLKRTCRVIWRSAQRIGVHFV